MKHEETGKRACTVVSDDAVQARFEGKFRLKQAKAVKSHALKMERAKNKVEGMAAQTDKLNVKIKFVEFFWDHGQGEAV